MASKCGSHPQDAGDLAEPDLGDGGAWGPRPHAPHQLNPALRLGRSALVTIAEVENSMLVTFLHISQNIHLKSA